MHTVRKKRPKRFFS